MTDFEPKITAARWLLGDAGTWSAWGDQVLTRMPQSRTVSRVTDTRVVPDAPHGTLRGWKMGCRCTCCQAANDADREDGNDLDRLPEQRNEE